MKKKNNYDHVHAVGVQSQAEEIAHSHIDILFLPCVAPEEGRTPHSGLSVQAKPISLQSSHPFETLATREGRHGSLCWSGKKKRGQSKTRPQEAKALQSSRAQAQMKGKPQMLGSSGGENRNGPMDRHVQSGACFLERLETSLLRQNTPLAGRSRMRKYGTGLRLSVDFAGLKVDFAARCTPAV